MKPFFLHHLRLLCFCFIYFCFLISCQQKSSSPAATSYPQEVFSHLGPRQFPQGLHPTQDFFSPVMSLVHLTLTTQDERGEQVPVLLTSLPQLSSEGNRITYQLRNDAKWPDGTPMTREDVFFSLKVLCSPQLSHPAIPGYFENILSMEADPENAYRFHLNTQPYQLNRYLSNYMMVLPRHQYDPQGELDSLTLPQVRDPQLVESHPKLLAWSQEFQGLGDYEEIKSGTQDFPDGIGPYRVVEWVENEYIRLEAREGYWGARQAPKAFLQAGVGHITYSLTDAVQAVATQQVDVVTDLSPSAIEQFDTDVQSQYQFKLVEGDRYACIMLNTQPDPVSGNPVFRDKLNRQALSLLMPLDSILTTRYGSSEVAEAIISPVPKNLKEYNPQLPAKTYNPQKARKLLTQAGWGDSNGDGILDQNLNGKILPFEFALMYKGQNTTYEVIAQQVKASLKKAGIACKLVATDEQNLMEKAMVGDFDAVIRVFSYQRPISDFKQLWHTSSTQGEGYNFSQFGNEQTDALIDSISHSSDPEEYTLLAKKFQALLYEEQPVIFLFAPKRGIGIRRTYSEENIQARPPFIRINNLTLSQDLNS